VDIRTDFMVYKNEHNRLIDALAKAKGISIAQLGPAMYKSSMKKFIKIYILLIIKLGLMLLY
jgi:hypothetical protein